MKYRKKPVVIDAFQVTRKTVDFIYNLTTNQKVDEHDSKAWPKWFKRAVYASEIYANTRGVEVEDDNFLYVETSFGDVKAYVGNWIIRGAEGELYPCDPDIFEQTYEKMEE